MRRAFFCPFLIVLTVLGPGFPVAAQTILIKGTESDQFTMMTYNIHAGLGGPGQWLPAEEGLENVAQVIEGNKPDILFLQEVERFSELTQYIDEFKWLQDRLDYPDAVYASAAQDPVPPETPEWGVAIYFGSGSVVSTQKYRLGWGRVLLRVTVSIHNTPMHFFCTHLGSGEVAQQAEEVGEILEAYTPLNEPIILGGDFNAGPESPALSPLRASLRNIFEFFPGASIDSFFVSPEITVLNAEVIPDPTVASDHEPVLCLLKLPIYRKTVILEQGFDGHADIQDLDKSPWWNRFGSTASYVRLEPFGGEAHSAPNVLYVMKGIDSHAGEQVEWLPRKPSPAAPLRFTWYLLHNQEDLAKGSVIASASSGYQHAIVSWYDPDPASTTYGIRCHDTFETGGNWSPEALSFNAPRYPRWNKFELVCKGSRQEVYVNNALVGTWGPAVDPAYDKFNLWQWGRCNRYEDHNPSGEGVLWIDDVSVKIDSSSP